LNVLTPDDPEHLSGITFGYAKKLTGEQLSLRLRKAGIVVAPRAFGVHSGLRVSPYFYNDEDDVEAFLDATKKAVRGA
jgi:selenocysteine lyase/cysteine desulfurase